MSDTTGPNPVVDDIPLESVEQGNTLNGDIETNESTESRFFPKKRNAIILSALAGVGVFAASYLSWFADDSATENNIIVGRLGYEHPERVIVAPGHSICWLPDIGMQPVEVSGFNKTHFNVGSEPFELKTDMVCARGPSIDDTNRHLINYGSQHAPWSDDPVSDEEDEDETLPSLGSWNSELDGYPSSETGSTLTTVELGSTYTGSSGYTGSSSGSSWSSVPGCVYTLRQGSTACAYSGKVSSLTGLSDAVGMMLRPRFDEYLWENDSEHIYKGLYPLQVGSKAFMAGAIRDDRRKSRAKCKMEMSDSEAEVPGEFSDAQGEFAFCRLSMECTASLTSPFQVQVCEEGPDKDSTGQDFGFPICHYGGNNYGRCP